MSYTEALARLGDIIAHDRVERARLERIIRRAHRMRVDARARLATITGGSADA